jgi:hypothetical protein
MLLIEYLNVLTRGQWDRVISRWTWGQSLFGAGLGATPGCLGAFAVVSLYTHRVATFGALVAAMIATCGDEAFVMLALFPGRALLLMGILFVCGLVSGWLVDLLGRAPRTTPTHHLAGYRAAHAEVESCVPFSRRELAAHWKHCTPHRGWLTLLLALFVAGVLSGRVGHRHLEAGLAGAQEHAVHEPHAAAHDGEPAHEHRHEHEHKHEHGHEGAHWNWVRVTLLLLGLVGLGIVASVPDHFLEEHLWNHLVRVHIRRLFLWTLGALLITHLLTVCMDVEAAVRAHRLPVLLLACLVGVIPESGPHLVFVGLYAQGAVPFSVLLASCIVQDGHGMIPLLAHSRRAFLMVKAFNLAVGLAAGLAGYLMAW